MHNVIVSIKTVHANAKLAIKASLCESRTDARRAVQQGGVSVDGEKVTDISTSYMLDEFAGEGKVVKRGKKKFAKVISK